MATRAMAIKRKYLPMGLKVAGRDCVMIGAGWEAADKGQKLLESGARVTFISPHYSKEDAALLTSLGGKILAREFQPSDLHDQFLVMLALKDNAALTEQVSRLCREKRILLCAIDQAAYCDLVNMSIYERGPLKICISTDGVSPAFAKKIRVGLEASLKDLLLETFMEDLSTLREKLEKEEADPSQRIKKLIAAVEGVTFQAEIKGMPNKKK